MLKQRIVTALVLLAVLLPALFYPSYVPFSMAMLVMVTAAGWEWGRLSGYAMPAALGVGAVVLGACAGSWLLGLHLRPLPWVWAVAGSAWVLLGAALLRVSVPGWVRVPSALRVLGGMAALWAAWLAVVQARVLGINFLLSVLVLVWVADVFAYFSGRAFGMRWSRTRLAPSISPGKSWEGVWGGMAGVVVLAVAWVLADRATSASVLSLFSRLAERSWWLVLLGALFLAAMSVVGDLVESLIKRSAGVKDSSQLLPGHGGVLDRVDALLPVLPLALMLVSL